ncbi:enoyl-CoA hydratase/isomerase family protein [Actinomadura graeca]|uniref:Enoyl-CoA hydratase/isomerase family protein n=1 Tax=Actinomadura graeca TaxID=2750812 RepID=A0ABX8R3N6_9ACTN|nr:enoyl-CoA hydratase/isomerase family protein [Actinomadura graeca]QXJ25640.1 enoyl-CoA hydratase/isomerase family protein [Actinomadura graeca]
MSTEPLRTDVNGPVGLVEIRRPHRRNAIDSAAATLLAEAVARLDADPGVTAIVLCGEGGDLSSGADTGEPAPDPAAVPWRETPHARLLRAVRTTALPVVAAVEGWALGLGLGLAGACTYAVAGSSARFGFPEARSGYFPMGAVPNVVRRVRPDVVLRWALTGRYFDTEEAAAHGLVTDAVPAGQALAAALDLAAALGSAPRHVVTEGMAWLRQWADHAARPLDEWSEARMTFEGPPARPPR